MIYDAPAVSYLLLADDKFEKEKNYIIVASTGISLSVNSSQVS